MSASTTQARRGSWGEVLAVLAVILGMLLGFGVVTAQPAFADGSPGTATSDADDETCDEAGFPEANKENTPNIGDSSSGDWGEIERTGAQVATATINEGYTVDICIKTGAAVTVYSGASCDHDEADDDVACVIEYDSSGQGGGVSHVSWDNAVFTEPDPSVTLLKVDENEEALAGASFLLDGETDYDCTSDNTGLCDFGQVEPGEYTLSETEAPEGYEDLTLTAEQESVTIESGVESIELGTFVNTPTPEEPTPAITLVKDAVVGEGSDLIDVDGPNPLLQFSDTDTESQTALYSYLITNTGDEALVNISLTDDRIAATDLDFSDCTAKEPLAPGDTCTATGSEDFDLGDAQDDEDGLITNTGTVEAEGDESGDDVSASDPATIALAIVFSEVNEKPDPAPEPEPEPEPAPEVESAAAELPATGLDREGLLPLSLLLIAMGAAILWLDRPWVGVR